jgi:hypothetical protein
MIKTVKVKLHNPSKHKRAILDRVFLRWTLAADVTLRWAEGHLDAFDDCKDAGDTYRANFIARVLEQHVRSRIKRFGLHVSLEDSLWRDVGKAIASYFEQLKQDPNTGFPTVPRAKTNPARYEAALEALAGLGGGKGERGKGKMEDGGGSAAEGDQIRNSQSEFRNLQGELLAAARELEFRARPIYLSRTDAVPRSRGYSILYDEEQDEYLVLMYLLSGSASRRYREPLTVYRPLLALNKHEEYLTETGRPTGALLFPLEMGDWQKENFFDVARDEPGTIRTAYLIREEDQQGEVEYYLAVAVDLPTSEPIETVNVMGVHHTLEGEVFALVTSPDGEALYYEQVAGPLELEDAYQQRRAWKRRGKRTPHRVVRERTRHHYHNASNRIVALAEEHRARVGVEDLSYRRTKTGRKATDRKLFGAAVGRLSAFLEYKLPFAGLPAPLKVGGVSPRECHRCGPGSREKTARAEGRIRCPLCGLDMDVHENNARLVAAQVPEIVERIAAARRKREGGKGNKGIREQVDRETRGER